MRQLENTKPSDPGKGPALVTDFAMAAEKVAATTRKLEKVAIIGEYLCALDDADLSRAARYLAGHQFAMNDSRTTNVGGSVISQALTEATGREPDNLSPRYVRLGDAGEVAYEVIEELNREYPGPSLTLAETESIIKLLSETSGTKNKKGILTTLFQRTSALEAKYIVKLLLGDLRIGLREGLIEDAVARAFKQPLAKISQAGMMLGDIGETAVRARRGDLHDLQMRLFHPLKFMLATPAADLSDISRQMPEEFFVEDKFDGIRGQAHAGGGRVAIYSRTMDEITGRFPELISPLAALRDSVIIDGEILAARGDHILPFSDLQKRLGRKTVSDELIKNVPVVLVAYDLLYGSGRILIDESFEERRRILEKLVKGSEALRISRTTRLRDVSLLDDEFLAARARGNEGLMVKDPRSSYKPGRRGREWLKVKRAIATLDVVVTAVEVGHGKRRHLLSDYTFAVRRSETDGELLNVGKAYSGLTDAELTEMTEWFRSHTIQEFAHGRVRLVEPSIVLEVTFDRVQESKRHKSGYALRFPRILRLRDDKTADEIDTLETLQKLAGNIADDRAA